MERWSDRSGRHRGRHRVGAALAALTINAVLLGVLVWGLAGRDEEGNGGSIETVAAFDVSPPEPEPQPEPEPRDASQGAPAPAGREGEALPVEAPVARVTLAPTPAVPVAGEGQQASAGSASQGTGPGAGGAGTGSGAGGTGTGSGGIATPARRIAGALRDSDYPRGAERQGIEGTVGISFRVRTDGRVDRCAVVRSSGHAVLDELTCRLFTERYRFRPAMTAEGRAVETTLRTSFTWGTRRR